ncbi:hypothetical protein EVAR_31445_1 [Eumeta japonica]|uniref:Uncharacterized protein n=1 Tax=Eumeta variegata TaxID=151549 RepID=A0A4C1UYH2_EUMVA|nr:hypothetical protein EVAR_31445_1 [Eumeta japonica]
MQQDFGSYQRERAWRTRRLFDFWRQQYNNTCESFNGSVATLIILENSLRTRKRDRYSPNEEVRIILNSANRSP